MHLSQLAGACQPFLVDHIELSTRRLVDSSIVDCVHDSILYILMSALLLGAVVTSIPCALDEIAEAICQR